MGESNWRLEKNASRGDSRFVLAQYYSRDQMEEDEMGGAHNGVGGEEHRRF